MTHRTMLHLLIPCLLVQIMSQGGAAFTLRPTTDGSAYTTNLYASSPLGDLFCGITGVAPSSLNPPSDVLAGTFIDPARGDVDLGRVYKVGGSAVIVTFGGDLQAL